MTFAKQMEAFAKKTNNKIEDVVGSVCFQLSESIVLRTPVDTGRARMNWTPSINKMSTEIIEGTDKTGAKVLSTAKQETEKASGNIFYLVNNLHYIKPLEYGHSKQAPQGMVRLSVVRFRQALKKAIK
jgi:hypothetical protein